MYADFNDWLAGKGFDPTSVTKEQKAPLQAMWRQEQAAATSPPISPPPPPPPPPATAPAAGDPAARTASPGDPATTFNAKMKVMEDETARQTYIRERTAAEAQRHVGNSERLQQLREMCDNAVKDQTCDARAYDLALLRWDRFAGPLVMSVTESQITPKVMEAALCRAGGYKGAERDFSPQVLESADRHYRRGVGLGEIVFHFAKQNGYTGRSIKDDPWGAVKAALNGSPVSPQPMSAAWGPSTGGGLSGVLSNTANKFLREGFDFVEGVWRQISAVRSVNDFKQITTYSVTGGLTHEELPPGGEIKHGTLGAETYTNQATTYARMLGIDRRDLINDDLGAFTTVGRKLGRGAAITLNKKFWGVFLNNSSFFTSGRANVSTGGGSALALAGLDAANQKFMLQTDPDGNLMGATPRILLAPPALSATADTLMSSTMLTIGSGTTAQGSANVWAGKFKSLTSAYMQDSTLTGNSSAAWYLLADPQDVPVIEVAFLNGVETPTVETAEADFNMLGIAMRAYLDYGIALQEYRGGVRSAGS